MIGTLTYLMIADIVRKVWMNASYSLAAQRDVESSVVCLIIHHSRVRYVACSWLLECNSDTVDADPDAAACTSLQDRRPYPRLRW